MSDTNEANKDPTIAGDTWKKLREDLIPTIVGAILGVPAWGIMLSQIFSILSQSDTFALSSLFRIFCLLYFTLPFSAIMLLVIFQLKDELVKQMRKDLLVFVMGAWALTLLYLFLPTNHFGTNSMLYKIYLWGSFLLSFVWLGKYVRDLWKAINNFYFLFLAKGPIAKLIDQPIAQPAIDKMRTDGAILINFSILLLFIPIQWIISILLTANYRLHNSYIFDLLCVCVYFLPHEVYRFWRWRYRNTPLEYAEVTSNTFIRGALKYFPVLLAAILFFSGHGKKTRSLSSLTEVRTESEWAEPLNLTGQDSTYTAHFIIAGLLVDTTLKELTLMQLLTERDSVEDKFRAAQSHYTSHAGWMFQYAHSEQSMITERRYDDLPLMQYHAILLSGHYSFDEVQDSLKRYKDMLNNVLRSQVDISSEQLFTIAREAQKTGIMVFVITLLILSFILLVLYFKDDKYQFSDKNEIKRIRKIMTSVAVLVGILIFPLLKVINREDIKPYDSYSLFKLGNWNLPDDKNAKPTALDSLKPQPSNPNCCCQPGPITNNYFDSAHISLGSPKLTVGITAMKDLVSKLDDLITALNKASDRGKNEYQDSLLSAQLAILNKTLQKTSQVRITNWPEAIRLQPIEGRLAKIDSLLQGYVANDAPIVKYMIPKDELLSEIADILKELNKLNVKGSPLNQKIGKQ